MGFLEVNPEIFRTFLEKFRKDFWLFFEIFVASLRLDALTTELLEDKWRAKLYYNNNNNNNNLELI